MRSSERIRAEFDEAMVDGGRGLSVADRLCHACVEVLDVDGAAISVIDGGASQGTFGSSSALSRRLDALQFTFGEGPCLDAVRHRRPVLVADLAHPAERRWPAFTTAVLESGVQAVFAMPVAVASSSIGALDLFRCSTGALSEEALSGGLLAAELAALPLLDLIAGAANSGDAGDGDVDRWAELASLERVEVYQATGMIMALLDVGPTEALARLRAHAFSLGLTASEVAWLVVERELVLEADPRPQQAGPQGGGS